MKYRHAIFFLLIISLTSCKDISENGTPPPVDQPVQPVIRDLFPFERTITDNSGRSINALVLAKTPSHIAISKGTGPMTEHFVIPLEKLTSEDQNYFTGIGDGGDIQGVKEIIARKNRLKNRVASWHSDPEIAERESSKLGIPMLLLVHITRNEASEALEKNLVFSQEFKKWANKNLVLCQLKVDKPNTKHTTSHRAAENLQIALQYGVLTFEGPTLLVKKHNGTPANISTLSVGSGTEAINAVYAFLARL